MYGPDLDIYGTVVSASQTPVDKSLNMYAPTMPMLTFWQAQHYSANFCNAKLGITQRSAEQSCY
jgi:hypothetical protein